MGISFPEIVGVSAMYIATIHKGYQSLLNWIAPVLLAAPVFYIYGRIFKRLFARPFYLLSAIAIITSISYVFYINILAESGISFHLRALFSILFFLLPLPERRTVIPPQS